MRQLLQPAERFINLLEVSHVQTILFILIASLCAKAGLPRGVSPWGTAPEAIVYFVWECVGLCHKGTSHCFIIIIYSHCPIVVP